MHMNLTPEFVAALLAARGQMPELSKNATANMGRYSYAFASLPHIIKTIEPALRANGIALSLPMDGDLQGCVLMHGSGGYIASWDRFTEYMDTEAERRWKRENNQAGAVSDIDKERVGATTSARRVLIAGIVGMTATDDAGGSQGGGVSNPQSGASPSNSGGQSRPHNYQLASNEMKAQLPAQFDGRAVAIYHAQQRSDRSPKMTLVGLATVSGTPMYFEVPLWQGQSLNLIAKCFLVGEYTGEASGMRLTELVKPGSSPLEFPQDAYLALKFTRTQNTGKDGRVWENITLDTHARGQSMLKLANPFIQKRLVAKYGLLAHDVQPALGVASLAQYTGSLQDAEAAVSAYKGQQSQAADQGAADVPGSEPDYNPFA